MSFKEHYRIKNGLANYVAKSTGITRQTAAKYLKDTAFREKVLKTTNKHEDSINEQLNQLILDYKKSVNIFSVTKRNETRAKEKESFLKAWRKENLGIPESWKKEVTQLRNDDIDSKTNE
jgi:hypothetical protein